MQAESWTSCLMLHRRERRPREGTLAGGFGACEKQSCGPSQVCQPPEPQALGTAP